MSTTTLPSDVYEDSRCRLPLPDRDGLDDAARKLYDRFADPDSGTYVGLRGPGGIRLHSPQNALCVQALNNYIRREAGITTYVRELSILVTARELDSQFEWTAHEEEALKAGVSPDVIHVVKYRKDTSGVPASDALLIRLGRQIFGDRRVTQETFAEALAAFGEKGLVDLVSLMANYAATAALLTAFDMQLHPEWEPLLPEL